MKPRQHERAPKKYSQNHFGIRFVFTLASYGSGVPGGVFAPMLALGVLLGVAFEMGVSEILAAFLCATVRAPLTGIALTIEMTGNLDLMLPLLIACLAVTAAAEALGSRPIYEFLVGAKSRARWSTDGAQVECERMKRIRPRRTRSRRKRKVR